jgi:hypothetical protein
MHKIATCNILLLSNEVSRRSLAAATGPRDPRSKAADVLDRTSELAELGGTLELELIL